MFSKNKIVLKNCHKYLAIILLLLFCCEEIPNKPERDNIFDPNAKFDSEPPVAKISVSQDTGFINETYFEFSAENSMETEHPNAVLYYKWDFNNDGIWDTELSSKKNIKVIYSDTDHSILNSITLNGPGEQTIRLFVLGASDTSTLTSYTIYVYDHPKIELDWKVDIIASRFYFDISGSVDWTGDTSVQCRWDFNNDDQWDTDWINDKSISFLIDDSFGSNWKTKLKIKDKYNLTSEKFTELYKPDLSDLIAYYPFSGNTLDSSGNNLNGTNNGAELSMDRYGNPESAYYFDGSQSYIDLGLDNLLKPEDAFSLSIWVKNTRPLTSAYPVVGIFTNNDNCDRNYAVNFWLNSVNAGNGETYAYVKRIGSSLDKWVHYVIVFSDYPGSYNNLQAYVNTNQAGSEWSGDISGLSYTGSPAVIGKICNYYFQGHLDEIYIYNRRLSINDIQNLYHSIK